MIVVRVTIRGLRRIICRMLPHGLLHHPETCRVTIYRGLPRQLAQAHHCMHNSILATGAPCWPACQHTVHPTFCRNRPPPHWRASSQLKLPNQLSMEIQHTTSCPQKPWLLQLLSARSPYQLLSAVPVRPSSHAAALPQVDHERTAGQIISFSMPDDMFCTFNAPRCTARRTSQVCWQCSVLHRLAPIRVTSSTVRSTAELAISGHVKP